MSTPDPAPGQGVNYTPETKPAPILSKSGFEAGITPPANEGRNNAPGQLIKQLPDDQLYKELDSMSLEDFIKKHTDDQQANIDTMARVTRLDKQEVIQIQKNLGYNFPEGA